LKYLIFSYFLLSLICIDFGIKTYEMYLANGESIELISEKKSEKEVEDIDKIDKLSSGDVNESADKLAHANDYFQLFYAGEQFFGKIPQPPPDYAA